MVTSEAQPSFVAPATVPPPVAAPAPWRRIAKRSALGVFAVAIIIEILMRMTGTMTVPPLLVADPRLGFRLRPGVEGSTAGGAVPFSINTAGWRDRERSRAKPPGTLRIAVVGDDYCEALEVPREDTFWAVLEHELKIETSFARFRDIEVLGFGVEGYGTAQELLVVREQVMAYHPDLVLLAFQPGNDVFNNSRALQGQDGRPFFELKDGRLALDDSFLRSKAYRRRSGTMAIVLRLAESSSRLVRSATLFGGLFRMDDASAGSENAGKRDDVARPPEAVVWKNAWSVTEALVLEMRREVEAAGARFAVVVLTMPVQVHPDPGPLRTFRRDAGIRDVRYPNDRMADFCREHGVPACNLVAWMSDYARTNHDLLHGSDLRLRGCWNALGHRVAGRYLAYWMVTDQDAASWFQ